MPFYKYTCSVNIVAKNCELVKYKLRVIWPCNLVLITRHFYILYIIIIIKALFIITQNDVKLLYIYNICRDKVEWRVCIPNECVCNNICLFVCFLLIIVIVMNKLFVTLKFEPYINVCCFIFIFFYFFEIIFTCFYLNTKSPSGTDNV